MIKLKKLIYESLDNPYRYKHTFRTEEVDVDDYETGEIYKQTKLYPIQIIKFKTDEGIPYLWYAKQNRHDDTFWNVAFGVEKSVDDKEKYTLDIGITGTRNAFRIFATVIDIINSFIEFDEDGEIQKIMFTAEGANRAKLYIDRIVPRIEKFKVEDIRNNLGETEILLFRNQY